MEYGLRLTGQLTLKSIYHNDRTGQDNYQIAIFDGFSVRRVSGVPKDVWDSMTEHTDVSINVRIYANYSQPKQSAYISIVYFD